jgi:hypothetical protein
MVVVVKPEVRYQDDLVVVNRDAFPREEFDVSGELVRVVGTEETVVEGVRLHVVRMVVYVFATVLIDELYWRLVAGEGVADIGADEVTDDRRIETVRGICILGLILLAEIDQHSIRHCLLFISDGVNCSRMSGRGE